MKIFRFRNSLLLSALCWLLCFGALAAAPALELDLNQALQTGLGSNLGLKADRVQTQKAASRLAEARGYSWGKLGVEASYIHMNSVINIYSPPVTVPFLHNLELPVPPVPVAPQDLTHLTLKAGVPLYTSGKIESAINQAGLGLSAQRSYSLDRENETAYRVGELFLNALLAKQVWEVNRQALESYQTHLSHAEKAYQSGVAAKYDVLRAQTGVEEQQKKLTQSANQYNLALSALKTELFIEDDSRLELKGSFFETEEKLTLEQALSKTEENPGLKALDLKVKALQMGEKVAAAEGKPQVAAVGQLETLTKQMAQTDPQWFYGLEAHFDLFDGGVNREKVEQHRLEAENTRLERKQASQQLKLAVQSAYFDMDTAGKSLQASRQAEKSAGESLRLAEKRFEVGTGTSLEVLDANLVLMVARIGEYQALCQQDQAYLKLHRYLGDIQSACREVQK